MLSPHDDYPVHQVGLPLDRVGTSDRNFYDRYYFNLHNTDNTVFFAFGLGVYPNLGVMDAFACGVIGTKHYIVRASRILDGDRVHTRVGPISVEVIEGLRRLRITCRPGDYPLSFDLTFDAWARAHEEPPFFRQNALRRTVMDYTRLTQLGRMDGEINIAGKRFRVDHDNWRSVRDRSWGIRPVGEPDPDGALVEYLADSQFFWNWSPVHFGDFGLLYTVSEESDGRRWNESGVRLMSLASGQEPVAAVSIEHDIRFVEGTRRFDGATLSLRFEDGGELVAEYTPRLWFLMAAIGYRGPWNHGQYQGRLRVEGDEWDAADDDKALMYGWLTETLCDVSVGGERGQGIFEMAVVGPHRRYGFEDMFGGWKENNGS
ncbi:MAG: hypothetical protein ACE5E4_05950 [Candidatus Binatia bacterium]